MDNSKKPDGKSGGKEDYKDFMKEWKAGKEAYNL